MRDWHRCSAAKRAFAPAGEHASRRPRSFRTSRSVDRDREGPRTPEIESLDPGHQRIAQAVRFGVLSKAPLLARFDETEAALAAAQEFGGSGAVGEPG